MRQSQKCKWLSRGLTRLGRKVGRRKMNPLSEWSSFTPVSVYFWFPINPFQCCDRAKFYASRNVPNWQESETESTSRHECSLQCRSLFSFILPPSLFPLSSIYPRSFVPSHFFGLLSQQCPSSGSLPTCIPRPSLQLRFCVLFSLSDHQFIKCLHTTEIIRGIPGCVSIS